MDLERRQLMKQLIAILVLVLPLAAAPLGAQAPPAGPTVLSGQVLNSDDGQPLPGAIVSLPALNLTATTDAEGLYTLTVPADLARGQTVELRATFSDLEPRTAEVTLTPGAVTQDFALGVAFFETITVGSRAVGAEAQKAVPVDVFTVQDIETAGASETNQILEALTPAFNFPRPTITDGTDTVRPATLRGLGSDQVLVLVNGKRRHTSALVHVNGSIGRGSTGVDLNAIPASAIERVEVLRDGAAAQYGSDAIAGVIDVVMKRGRFAPTVSVTGGEYFTADYPNDGRNVNINGSCGLPRGAGSFMIAAE